MALLKRESAIRLQQCGAKHDKKLCMNCTYAVIPLPVRPGKIGMCHQTFEAHGQKR
jgi:hypothetical protein